MDIEMDRSVVEDAVKILESYTQVTTPATFRADMIRLVKKSRMEAHSDEDCEHCAIANECVEANARALAEEAILKIFVSSALGG